MNILNLGAGVQSTALALMSARGEIEKMDYAIFADTQEEPAEVYEHLEWLKTQLPFPVLVGTAGKLGDDLTSTTKKRAASIPAFTSIKEGEKSGIVIRQCTGDYKINVVNRIIRRQVLGLAPKKRIPDGVSVKSFFGLSFDESRRVVRVKAAYSGIRWNTPVFPLWDMEMTRRHCEEWLRKNFPDRKVARSACVFCPYKSNAEWRRLRAENPAGWARAVEVDNAMRRPGAACSRGLRSKLYVHSACVPLEQVDLRDDDDRRGQLVFGMQQDCMGMCGV